MLRRKVETSFGPVGITRVHLEEDTGKLQHQTISVGSGFPRPVSLIDFNRSSVPLIEIVTEPEIYSSAQAKSTQKNSAKLFVTWIFQTVIWKRRDEVGSQYFSSKKGETKLPNYKVELKNINSFRFLERGIEYEIERQKEILETGKTPDQETRGYNSEKNITYTQRSKKTC